MFNFDQPLIVAGLLLGLASSLHCFGMCSGIAASLCLTAPSGSGNSLFGLCRMNLLVNAGRITGYVLAGVAVGGLGTAAFGMLDHSIAHLVLRWAAAVSLGWIGLSMIGVMPLPLIQLGAAVSHLLAAASDGCRPRGFTAPFMAGCVWGFLPCAMVYGALFYAMLSGSWSNGAIVMLGFGLGTLPPIVAAGLGLPWLRSRASSPWPQKVVGLAIVGLGIISTLPTATIAGWCGVG